ncbi:SDR family oxidoreductase [Helicobacter cetorum]|uniref:Short-chain oxidoreductase n=1 Tax=Helicobacter cetorum (strain ATCC BAA-429 / MIT 00-7128) TaxID=182217 RepID=I0EMA8_HELC0|nr:SDR family oxidoreductase [Helicobacter cetorum]AFI04077.1 short-chain oxidoreductase [Helicobacter cetorum MIT 00-7128]
MNQENSNIEKKVAVITGASSGIGLECAILLLEKGYKVYALARHASLCPSLKHAMCEAIDIDVSDSSALQEVLSKIKSQEIHCDVLINSAGYGLFGSLEDTPMNEIKRQFDVNFFALCEVTHTLLPLLKNKPYSKIINLSSVAGRTHMLFLGYYNASKHALEAYSDVLRKELMPFKVQVCLIEPWAVRSNWDYVAFDDKKFEETSSVYAKELNMAREFYSSLYKHALSTQKVAQKIMSLIAQKEPKPRSLLGIRAKFLLILEQFLPSKWHDYLFRKVVLKEGA